MELIADRFVAIEGCRVVDLATGHAVQFVIGTAGGESEQVRWAARCRVLQNLHHQCIARLVDYGAIGESQRFEAWGCGARFVGAGAERERALVRAAAFLRARGLTVGRAAAVSIHRGPVTSRAVYLLCEEAGYPAAEVAACDELPLDVCGLATIDRGVVAPLDEVFYFTRHARPQIIGLFGPPGSGKKTVALELARSARLQGVIPVSYLLATDLKLPVDRSVCLIGEAQHRSVWRTLLDASIRWPRPHIMIVTAHEEVRGVPGVGLASVPEAVLAGAVRPHGLPPPLLKRVHRAAVQAQGLPLVTEHAAPNEPRPSRGRARLYAVPGDLSPIRERMATGVRWIEAGRHRPGVRLLRRSIGALVRREDWAHARDGSLALAAGLLRHGRPGEAQVVLDDARRYGGRMGDDIAFVDLATMHGLACIDLVKLSQAESGLGGAVAAAQAAGDTARAESASLALARCLLWQGNYGDAASALGAAGDQRIPRLRLSARLAVGCGDLPGAMAAAAEAVDHARGTGDARAKAAAGYTTAFVHLAVGDLDAVSRATGDLLASARAARDPLRAVRVRLVLAEVERRRGRRAVAGRVVDRLLALDNRLPPLLRVRCQLLRDLLAREAAPEDTVARHVAATGLGGLALCVPRADPTGNSGLDPLAREVVEILRLCQTADEETRVLTALCERLRQHLHAAAVAFVTGDGARPTCLASAGARPDFSVALRSMATGVAIAPHRCENRIEGAAPVQYGGAVLAALAARWTIGSPYDLSQAGRVLEMAAAASAPLVAGARFHQARAVAPVLGEILGMTPIVEELRRLVERAALAPFPVLIGGESGSGKELVARAIHRCGPRRSRPFCTVNCAALPDDLVESELFGHARGAFTGAFADRAGVFEEAHTGTLFLDEVGELSARAQAKVLRVLQEGELRRVGENVPRRIDVRLVAATNRDLAAEVSAGRFRLDLSYRLDVIRVAVPPLRERAEDVPMLVDHFWREATARMGSRATLAPATVARLVQYAWPGNVREVQNVLASLAVRCPKRGIVPPTALPPQFAAGREADAVRLDEARRLFEARFVREALLRTAGHRARAARELGVSRQGLTKLMVRLGIE